MLGPRPPVVVVVGPDGAGKSTLVDQLAELATSQHVRVRRWHARPGYLVPKRTSETSVIAPHGRSQRGRILSFLKVLLVFMDYVTHAFWARVAGRRTGLYLVERGWHDMAVDPLRYRLHPDVAPAIHRLGRLLPSADLAVAVSGDPRVISERKGELDTADVAQQIERWRTLLPDVALHSIAVDTTNSEPAVVAQSVWNEITPNSVLDSWVHVPFTPPRVGLRVTKGCTQALAIHRPMTRRTRIGRLVGDVLVRLRLAPGTTPPDFDLAALCSMLEVVCDGAGALRSSRSGRWIVRIVSNDLPDLVAKVGRADDVELQHEAVLMARLMVCDDAPTPRVVTARSWRGSPVVVTQALDNRLNEPHLDEVAALCTRLTQGIGNIGPLVHGDLAPWNVLRSGRELVLVDWEQARRERLPLFDLSHYVIRAGARLDWFTPQRAVQELTWPTSPGATHLEAVDGCSEAAPKLVHSYLRATEGEAIDRRELWFRSRVLELLS